MTGIIATLVLHKGSYYLALTFSKQLEDLILYLENDQVLFILFQQ